MKCFYILIMFVFLHFGASASEEEYVKIEILKYFLVMISPENLNFNGGKVTLQKEIKAETIKDVIFNHVIDKSFNCFKFIDNDGLEYDCSFKFEGEAGSKKIKWNELQCKKSEISGGRIRLFNKVIDAGCRAVNFFSGAIRRVDYCADDDDDDSATATATAPATAPAPESGKLSVILNSLEKNKELQNAIDAILNIGWKIYLQEWKKKNNYNNNNGSSVFSLASFMSTKDSILTVTDRQNRNMDEGLNEIWQKVNGPNYSLSNDSLTYDEFFLWLLHEIFENKIADSEGGSASPLADLIAAVCVKVVRELMNDEELFKGEGFIERVLVNPNFKQSLKDAVETVCDKMLGGAGDSVPTSIMNFLFKKDENGVSNWEPLMSKILEKFGEGKSFSESFIDALKDDSLKQVWLDSLDVALSRAFPDNNSKSFTDRIIDSFNDKDFDSFWSKILDKVLERAFPDGGNSKSFADRIIDSFNDRQFESFWSKILDKALERAFPAGGNSESFAELFLSQLSNGQLNNVVKMLLDKLFPAGQNSKSFAEMLFDKFSTDKNLQKFVEEKLWKTFLEKMNSAPKYKDVLAELRRLLKSEEEFNQIKKVLENVYGNTSEPNADMVIANLPGISDDLKIIIREAFKAGQESLITQLVNAAYKSGAWQDILNFLKVRFDINFDQLFKNFAQDLTDCVFEKIKNITFSSNGMTLDKYFTVLMKDSAAVLGNSISQNLSQDPNLKQFLKAMNGEGGAKEGFISKLANWRYHLENFRMSVLFVESFLNDFVYAKLSYEFSPSAREGDVVASVGFQLNSKNIDFMKMLPLYTILIDLIPWSLHESKLFFARSYHIMFVTNLSIINLHFLFGIRSKLDDSSSYEAGITFGFMYFDDSLSKGI